MLLDGHHALWHNLGMTLPEYLAKEHLNESEFARVLGVPSSTVHRWVRGLRRPSIASLIRIESVTGRKVQMKDFDQRTEAAE